MEMTGRSDPLLFTFTSPSSVIKFVSDERERLIGSFLRVEAILSVQAVFSSAIMETVSYLWRNRGK